MAFLRYNLVTIIKEDIMVTKEKIKEEIVRRECVSDAENQYTYLLIKREGEFVCNFKLPLYSIRVELIKASGEASHCEISNVFASETKARRFFDDLIKNQATPMNLPYVMEDALEF
jgi:hypothetical protein